MSGPFIPKSSPMAPRSVPPYTRAVHIENVLAATLSGLAGCVSETWAALLAHHQAARAHEPSVRSAFTEIARDETRHAQLAWDLHEWFLSQLAPAQQSLVLAAHARAIAELPAQAQAQAQAAPPAFGVPAPALAVRLAKHFGARLLAA